MKNTLKILGIATMFMTASCCYSCNEEVQPSDTNTGTIRHANDFQIVSGVIPARAETTVTTEATTEVRTNHTTDSYVVRLSSSEQTLEPTVTEASTEAEVTYVTTVNVTANAWDQVDTTETYSDFYSSDNCQIVWKDGYQYYVVASGDSWFEISGLLDVDPIQLAAANGCSLNDVICAGDYLFIPNEYVDYTQMNCSYMLKNTACSEEPTYSQESYENQQYNYSYSNNSGTCLSSVTLYSMPDYTSWNNIQVSLETLNGMTLAPGETFNWDNYIGWATTSTSYGYQEAPVFFGTETGYETGGGVCVTSTALFQAARSAGMNIVERHDHSQRVGYATPGNEAAVSYGCLNLVFTNTTGQTVVFYTSCSYGCLTVSCYVV